VNEPRKPIFGFLWPKPDPDAPKDAAYVQLRPLRVPRRGPIRVLGLTACGLIAVITVGSALLAGMGAGLSPAVVVIAAMSATVVALVLRGSAVGTYVTDHEVRIETMLRRTEIPWSEVRSVSTEDSDTPFLGLPIPVPGRWTSLHLADGTTVRTHVYSTSPDLWLRAEAFDMARLRLEHFHSSGAH